MKTVKSISILSAFIIASIFSTCAQVKTSFNLDDYEIAKYTSKDLKNWDFYGLGRAYEAGGGQLCLSENDSTYGAVLISPESYSGDVIVRYKSMLLTPASVLVTMLYASDSGSEGELSIPDDYFGKMSFWTKEKQDYFFAIQVAQHNYPPFIRKYVNGEKEVLGSGVENVMLPGKYHDIELGRIGNKLWLSIDGEKIVEAVDEEIIPGGHIIFRIRGTAGFKGACLIKDVEIFSTD